MDGTEIRRSLFELRDETYRDFQIGLIPGLSADRAIGVRTPALRALAKQIAASDGADAFLSSLPHEYFDENQLHAFIISDMRDFDRCVAELTRFLPYVDNWATCDQMSPKVFKKHRPELLPLIRSFLSSDRTYTVRFGIGMLMEHFLDEDFDSVFLSEVAALSSDEYYVNMMIAWYFATALAKRYDETIAYLERRELPVWVHNKTIQKAVESYRVSDEHKGYLRTLRIKTERKQ